MSNSSDGKLLGKSQHPRQKILRAAGSSQHDKNLKILDSLLCGSDPAGSPQKLVEVLLQTACQRLGGLLAEVWEQEGAGALARRAACSAQQLYIAGDMAASLQSYATQLQELTAPYEGPPFLERPPELAGRRPVVLLAQPLKLDGKVRGWLTLYRAARLDRPARQWLCLFANVAALLLERTALLREKEKAAQLQSVWKASKVLHSTLDLGELMELILELATLAVSAERGTVFLVDAQTRELWSIVAMGLKREEIRLPLGQGVAGHVAETGNILYIPDAYQSPLFDSSFDQKFGFRSRSILCLPIRNNRGEVLGVLELLNKKEGEFQPEDVEVLDPLTIHIALALENALRHREILARQRMEKELALARGIQRSLLPASPPLVPGYDIAALHESCFEVGGDYYDFLSLGPNTLLLVVADVEGKGVSSALIMSNLQASLRALVMNQHSLEVIVRSLNEMIRQDTQSQKFLSMFLGLIDTRGRSLHYINAGHVPPLVIRARDEIISLASGGILIGLFDSPEYERGKLNLLPGDALVLCTDGIVEAADTAGEEYGSERLVELIRHNPHRTATELVEMIHRNVEEFSRGGIQADDRVLMIIKIQERPSAFSQKYPA